MLAKGTLFESEEHYIYDGGQLSAVIDGTATPDVGTVQRRVVNGSVTDAPLFDEVYASGSADRLFFAAADHAGSVRDVIDGDNTNLVNHLEYDAFGEIVLALNPFKEDIATNALAIDAAFAGREWDDDADLYYNRARWYNPELGRFISEDPIGFADGPNVYRYAGNDPVNFRDPTGNFGFFSALIGIGVGLLVDFLDQEINGDGGSVGINIGIGIGGGGVDVNVSADIGDVRITAGIGDPPQTDNSPFMPDSFPGSEQAPFDDSGFSDLEIEQFAQFEEQRRIAFFGITDNRGLFGLPQRRGGFSAFSQGAFQTGQGTEFEKIGRAAQGATSLGIGVAEFGAGATVPGVGELQDAAVLADPTSPAWQKWISSISLSVAAIVGGVGPNAGTFFRIFRSADDGANVAGGAARGLLKASETVGRPVEAVVSGRKVRLRVDIEPGGKLQIQAGRGKNSLVDFRPNLENPLGPQIDKAFRAIPQSARDQLKKNAQKGLDRLRETGNL